MCMCSIKQKQLILIIIISLLDTGTDGRGPRHALDAPQCTAWTCCALWFDML